jgi:hypothetical protein
MPGVLDRLVAAERAYMLAMEEEDKA